LNGISILDHCLTVRGTVARDLQRQARDSLVEIDARLTRASDEFDRLVRGGFARLSAGSLLVQPGIGVVAARLRTPQSILPLATDFERLAIHRADGGLLWIASDPLRGDDAGRGFADVRAFPGECVDSTGVAAAVRADGEVVLVRLDDREHRNRLRLARAFHTDPYDSCFVMFADLSLADLVAGIDGVILEPEESAPGGGDPAWVSAYRRLSPATALAAEQTGGPEVMSSGPWHDEVLAVLAPAEVVGVAVSRSVAMRPHYSSVVHGARHRLLGTLLIILLAALVLWRCSRDLAVSEGAGQG